MSKAGRLIKLKNEGFSIPDFIVIKDKNDIDELKKLNTNVKYSVRSSASVEDGESFSFAGVFDTYLNVNYKKLRYYINKCLSSIKSEDVNEYIKNCNVKIEDIKMEIIIQKMIDSDISGVAFTYNPMNQTEEIIIEAVYGLGSGLVDGKFTPDIIHVNCNEMNYHVSFQQEMLACNIKGGITIKNVPIMDQSKHKLSNNKINKLLRLIERLKLIYKFPFEIEWTYSKGKLYLLQLRPITNVKNNN